MLHVFAVEPGWGWGHDCLQLLPKKAKQVKAVSLWLSTVHGASFGMDEAEPWTRAASTAFTASRGGLAPSTYALARVEGQWPTALRSF
jgi:hypothetical protein